MSFIVNGAFYYVIGAFYYVKAYDMLTYIVCYLFFNYSMLFYF